jgi:crotonobetainyl-CoA:carnitine CoA-transferase CaiB-like acyl-CoA transferase
VLGYEYPDGRAARMIANPIRVPGVDLPHRAAPRMGEHNDALLAEAGFDAGAIRKLRELGVIAGTSPAEHGVGHDTGHAAGP